MTGRRPLVALATSGDWPELAPDDRLITPALAQVGVDARIAVWTDEGVDWERFDLIVIRSCWDYHDDLSRWFAWLDALGGRGLEDRLCNPAAALRWNARKTYLRDLGACGVSVVPTRWLDAPALVSWEAFEPALQGALDLAPWDDVVCKPAVSAGALGTLRLERAALSTPSVSATLHAVLPTWARRAPLLIQPFLPEIVEDGEWSLLFFDGVFSHAVCKRPATGDFRVQEKHGGTTVAAPLPPSLCVAARQVLEVAAREIGMAEASALLYARVDLVVSAGQPLLIELELIEPALFLTAASGKAQAGGPGGGGESASLRFGRAIARRALAHHRGRVGSR